MTTDRETLRAIDAWLEEGRTALPDHVLDAVLEQLPSKPQRRPTWAVRRINHMNPIAKYAMAAAAVVAIAIVGMNLVGTWGTSQVGSQPSIATSPLPSSAPSSSPARLAPSSGLIDAGRYRWDLPGGSVSFDLPDGWTAEDASILKNEGTDAEIGIYPSFPGHEWEVTHVYSDACFSANALEPIGDTAADLVAALDNQKSTDVLIRDVTAGSVVGQRVEVFEDPNLDDRSACRHGSAGPLQIWSDEHETGWYFAIFPGVRGVAYVFDVDGDRLVFSGAYGPEAAEADVAAIDKIVESMEFEPR